MGYPDVMNLLGVSQPDARPWSWAQCLSIDDSEVVVHYQVPVPGGLEIDKPDKLKKLRLYIELFGIYFDFRPRTVCDVVGYLPRRHKIEHSFRSYPVYIHNHSRNKDHSNWSSGIINDVRETIQIWSLVPPSYRIYPHNHLHERSPSGRIHTVHPSGFLGYSSLSVTCQSWDILTVAGSV